MSIRNNYTHTLWASCIGYVVQAIVINFAPLLFVMFNTSYGISYNKISLLITLIFFIQLTVDLICPSFIDKIGYRISVVAAHAFAAFGLILLAFLPDMLPNPYIGLLISLIFTSIGGGLIEVVVSPIVEACPHENKNGYMCLLHSFYCWGHVFVVLMGVGYFAIFGIENWRYLSLIFAIVPFLNIFYYLAVPIISLDEVALESTGKHSLSLGQLAQNKLFWLMFLLMFCAGACELSVSQWASALAEQGLNVSKTVGDLAGPLTFAVTMGTSRVVYSRFGSKISLEKYMLFCAVLCFASYLIISLSPFPFMSLIGCAICGWSVGVMWPGTYSMASASIKGGSTAMFAILALAGDLGCSVGPTVVGFVSDAMDNNLKIGILSAIIFSVIMIFGVLICINRKHRKSS
ncbi:MAG: MFS transporter [Clostridia bacterium]|nr:MFS transporter [Clostridia bacterium]